jgi:hypothetical protein
MTPEQQRIEQAMSEPDEHFLPASSPWLARYFVSTLQLIEDLQGAAALRDFVPACIDDKALADLIERFGKAWAALPSVYDDEKNPPPLELIVLDRALYLLEEFLKLEQERRKDDPAYAAECKGANEVKRYRVAHNGAWPPAVFGWQANG